MQKFSYIALAFWCQVEMSNGGKGGRFGRSRSRSPVRRRSPARRSRFGNSPCFFKKIWNEFSPSLGAEAGGEGALATGAWAVEGVAEAGAEAPSRKGEIQGAEAGALFCQNSPLLDISLFTELFICTSGLHLQSMLTASQGPGTVRLWKFNSMITKSLNQNDSFPWSDRDPKLQIGIPKIITTLHKIKFWVFVIVNITIYIVSCVDYQSISFWTIFNAHLWTLRCKLHKYDLFNFWVPILIMIDNFFMNGWLPLHVISLTESYFQQNRLKNMNSWWEEARSSCLLSFQCWNKIFS